MPKVYFVVENVSVDAESGQSIREIALKHGLYLNREFIYHLNCAGHGICGTCRVWVKGKTDSALSPRTMREKAFGMRGMQRLACQTRVHGDVEVYSTSGGDDRLDPERTVDPPVVDWYESTADEQNEASPESSGS